MKELFTLIPKFITVLNLSNNMLGDPAIVLGVIPVLSIENLNNFINNKSLIYYDNQRGNFLSKIFSLLQNNVTTLHLNENALYNLSIESLQAMQGSAKFITLLLVYERDINLMSKAQIDAFVKIFPNAIINVVYTTFDKKYMSCNSEKIRYIEALPFQLIQKIMIVVACLRQKLPLDTICCIIEYLPYSRYIDLKKIAPVSNIHTLHASNMNLKKKKYDVVNYHMPKMMYIISGINCMLTFTIAIPGTACIMSYCISAALCSLGSDLAKFNGEFTDNERAAISYSDVTPQHMERDAEDGSQHNLLTNKSSL